MMLKTEGHPGKDLPTTLKLLQVGDCETRKLDEDR